MDNTININRDQFKELLKLTEKLNDSYKKLDIKVDGKKISQKISDLRKYHFNSKNGVTNEDIDYLINIKSTDRYFTNKDIKEHYFTVYHENLETNSKSIGTILAEVSNKISKGNIDLFVSCDKNSQKGEDYLEKKHLELFLGLAEVLDLKRIVQQKMLGRVRELLREIQYIIDNVVIEERKEEYKEELKRRFLLLKNEQGNSLSKYFKEIYKEIDKLLSNNKLPIIKKDKSITSSTAQKRDATTRAVHVANNKSGTRQMSTTKRNTKIAKQGTKENNGFIKNNIDIKVVKNKISSMREMGIKRHASRSRERDNVSSNTTLSRMDSSRQFSKQKSIVLNNCAPFVESCIAVTPKSKLSLTNNKQYTLSNATSSRSTLKSLNQSKVISCNIKPRSEKLSKEVIITKKTNLSSTVVGISNLQDDYLPLLTSSNVDSGMTRSSRIVSTGINQETISNKMIDDINSHRVNTVCNISASEHIADSARKKLKSFGFKTTLPDSRKERYERGLDYLRKSFSRSSSKRSAPCV